MMRLQIGSPCPKRVKKMPHYLEHVVLTTRAGSGRCEHELRLRCIFCGNYVIIRTEHPS